MKFRQKVKEFKDDLKVSVAVNEVKDHVVKHKTAYICVTSVAGGLTLAILLRRGNQVNVNVSVNLNQE